jgi:hypothetical protein
MVGQEAKDLADGAIICKTRDEQATCHPRVWGARAHSPCLPRSAIRPDLTARRPLAATLSVRIAIYSDASKDFGVFMNIDPALDLNSPMCKNRDYFLGLL